MKSLTLFWAILFPLTITSQTIITQSNSPYATSNHNQRKIIRDSYNHVYLVFEDIENDTTIIKYTQYDYLFQTWNIPIKLFDGNSPTIAISRENKQYITYCSNDSLAKIMVSSKPENENWCEPIVISNTSKICKLPVTDVDSSGCLNVAWIQKNTISNDIIKFSKICNDSVYFNYSAFNDFNITDVAIANNLQFSSNRIYISYQTNSEIKSYYKKTNSDSVWINYENHTGSSPCLSVGNITPELISSEMPRIMFLDSLSRINLNQYYFYDDSLHQNIQNNPMLSDSVNYIVIDNIIVPIGFSFLQLKSDTLINSFFQEYNVKNFDTIVGNPIYPSIAYKHFNPDSVDFVWMSNNGTNYDIYYLRSEKVPYLPGSIKKQDKDDDIYAYGFPNPFSNEINIVIHSNSGIPVVKIYYISGKEYTLKSQYSSINKTYNFIWDGKDSSGNIAKSGTYFLNVSCNNKVINRRIIKISQ